MTSSWFLSQGALHAIFNDGFWKSDHDFLIALHNNFLSGMRGFRDNDQFNCGNDVIVISLLRGVKHRFCWQNLKDRPQFNNHGSLTHFAYLVPFQSYSTLYFGWYLPLPTHFRGVFWVKHPQLSELHTSHSKKGLPYTRPNLLSYCARKLVQGYGL